jgi:hypothetical protein
VGPRSVLSVNEVSSFLGDSVIRSGCDNTDDLYVCTHAGLEKSSLHGHELARGRAVGGVLPSTVPKPTQLMN